MGLCLMLRIDRCRKCTKKWGEWDQKMAENSKTNVQALEKRHILHDREVGNIESLFFLYEWFNFSTCSSSKLIAISPFGSCFLSHTQPKLSRVWKPILIRHLDTNGDVKIQIFTMSTGGGGGSIVP